MFVYRFIYFKLYKWNLKSFGNSDLPELNSLLIISLFTLANLITVTLLLDIVLPLNIFRRVASSSIISVSLVITSLLLNVFAFGRNGKIVLNRISEFESLSGKRLVRYNLFLLFYVALSILAPVALALRLY